MFASFSVQTFSLHLTNESFSEQYSLTSNFYALSASVWLCRLSTSSCCWQLVSVWVLLTCQRRGARLGAGRFSRCRITLSCREVCSHLGGQTPLGFITLILVHALVLGWSQSHCWISHFVYITLSSFLFSHLSLQCVLSCVYCSWGCLEPMWYLATHLDLDCKLKFCVLVNWGKEVCCFLTVIFAVCIECTPSLN